MTDRPFEARPAEGLHHANVVAMFAARVARSGDAAALRHRADGTWKTITWRQWFATAGEIASGLRAAAALAPGERVALACKTRVEWALCDLALARAGAVSVPIYASLTAEQIGAITADAEISVVIAEDPEIARRVLEGHRRAGGRCPRAVVVIEPQVEVRRAGPGGRGEGPRELVGLEQLRAAAAAPFDGDGPDAAGPLSLEFEALRTQGREALPEHGPELDAIARALSWADPFTFVYTSGTTGQPKGAVLSHKNLVYEAWAIRNVVPVDATDEQLMVLPLAHIFARHMLWGAVEQGAVTAFGTGEGRDLEGELREVAPTYVAAVPRVFEKIANQIRGELDRASPTRRAIARWCLDVGRRLSAAARRGEAPSAALAVQGAVAERLMFGELRARFGGRLRFFVSGGAPLAQDVAEFFHALGVLILEGYGLTETTGATNVNRPDRFRFGTVGPAMPGCELRIADDGEVLVRGHNVMAGYYRRPEDTAAMIDEQGWLHTGDIGELRDGFLRITDRKKDLIKTAGGKYIAPQPIEGKLATRPGIAHAIVHADYKPFAVALIALDEDAMMRVSEREGLGCRSYADLSRHPRIRQLVQAEIDAVNAELASFETVKRFAIPRQPFTIEAGDLTPTHKVRRRAVAERHRELIERMYEGVGSVDLPQIVRGA
jgi:long-chain acyl-CoA synthetase